MKKLTYLVVIMLLSMVVNAQTTIIKGKVIDKKTNEAVAFANIMVMSDTSKTAKLISGLTADNNGEFSLAVKTIKPILKINSLGYKDNIFTVKVANFKKEANTINIGTIFLEFDAENLQEVSIVGKQTRIEMDNDKIVMNVDEGLSATTANVFEMLRKVPGVVIDKDENLTLQGQSGVLFQFDGRDIRIPYNAIKSILKGMSPNDVAKIETITIPSAKYEAEGTAGIINIITAKKKTTGFSGDIHSWTGFNKDFKTFDGANLNWITNRWTISAGAGYNRYASRNSMELKQYLWNNSGDTTLMHMLETENKNQFNGMDFNLSADYKINDKNSIGAMVSFNRNFVPSLDQPIQINQISKYPYSVIDSSYTNKSNNEMNNNDLMASLYYNRKIDTLGGQYSAALDFSHNKSFDKSNSLTEYFSGDRSIFQRQENLTNKSDNKYSSYSGKFDVIKPLNKKMTLEFGVKSRLALIDNNFKAKVNNILDKGRSQEFSYKENVNAAYISFSDKLNDKFSWRIGLRGEHTFTSFDQKTTSQKHDRNYFSLFPNVNINYKVGKMDNISLTYSYRISRPDYNSLNPFITKTSDYSYQTGNPYLDPQYTHKIDLNYAFHYMIFLTASYAYTDDEIVQLPIANSSTLATTRKSFNLGYSQNASLGLSSMLPLGPVEWTIWMQGVYGMSKANNKLANIDISKFSFMTWQSLSIDFFFKSKLSVSCFYSTGGVQFGGEYDNMMMWSVALSKDFLEKQLKVSVGVDNLPKRNFNVASYNTNYKMNMNMCWQRPQLTFNITYSFGQVGKNDMLKRIESNDMDSRASGESNFGKGSQQGQGM